ncbi:hypothetical protein [uncultured Pseudokineococcus sp.]|uniref:hypothetical protein n=1 Tax=uncultured Pseudokineococcus sp. TaxID=1642928 RepID=UPI002634BFEF|nr:hypothetical protein [uncultured Pseudokineococcus sp.]
MRVLLDDKTRVSYRQMYLGTGGELKYVWEEAFEGQTNGILGAARLGQLTVSSGVHSGFVGVRVTLSDSAPPIDPSWEDVVEVSLTASSEHWGIVEGIVESGHGFEGAGGEYRVRMSVKGMDAGAAADVVSDDDPLVEHHLFEFWPAPWAADEIVRRGSDYAARRHQDVS